MGAYATYLQKNFFIDGTIKGEITIAATSIPLLVPILPTAPGAGTSAAR